MMTKEQYEYMEHALRDIETERHSQNNKFGVQRHAYGAWLAILVEEVGEAAQAVNRVLVPAAQKETDADNLYEELIQIAAVATAFAEQVREEMERGPVNDGNYSTEAP